jgi:hypothetical protein
MPGYTVIETILSSQYEVVEEKMHPPIVTYFLQSEDFQVYITVEFSNPLFEMPGGMLMLGVKAQVWGRVSPHFMLLFASEQSLVPFFSHQEALRLGDHVLTIGDGLNVRLWGLKC